MRAWNFAILIYVFHLSNSLKNDIELDKRIAMIKACSKIECPPVHEPVCAKLVYNDTGSVVHAVLFNKCEQKYVHCYPGVQVKLVPMKYCSHGPGNTQVKETNVEEKTIGHQRIKREMSIGSDSKNVYKTNARRFLPFLLIPWIAAKAAALVAAKAAAVAAAKVAAVAAVKAAAVAAVKATAIANGAALIGGGGQAAIKLVTGAVVEVAAKKAAVEVAKAAAKAAAKKAVKEAVKEAVEAAKGSAESAGKGVAEGAAHAAAEGAADAAALAAAKGAADAAALATAHGAGLAAAEAAALVVAKSAAEAAAEISISIGVTNLIQQNENLELDPQDKKENENIYKLFNWHQVYPKADKNNYLADCPKVCPIRPVMVCGRCAHGIYSTFLSVCHMRMHACKFKNESIELVSRSPCMMSAPILPVEGETIHPSGIINEPNDDDKVLRFIWCRDDPKGAYCQRKIEKNKVLRRENEDDEELNDMSTDKPDLPMDAEVNTDNPNLSMDAEVTTDNPNLPKNAVEKTDNPNLRKNRKRKRFLKRKHFG